MSESIPTRPFGHTGERTTVVGLGGAVLTQRSYAEGVATVRHARDLGITYFDTSPGYGGGQSQAIMGEGLGGSTAGHLLATKLGYFSNAADFRSEDAIRAQIHDNLRLLRRDYVDALQVHEANWACWWADGVSSRGEHIRPDQEYAFADAPVMRVLREAREQGLCRFIGITGNVADQMTRVLRHVEADTILMAFNYDPIWRGACREAIPLAKQKGVVLILAAIFHGGRLVRSYPEWLTNPPDWMTPTMRDGFARLYALQRESGLSLVTLAVRYVLSQPDASTILIGAATPAELEESVAAAIAGPLPADLLEAIDALGQE